MIESIVDDNGVVVYKHSSQPEVVFSEQTAFLMTDMLRTVISSGTGTTVRKYVGYDIDIAGKTGTTNDNKDAWFIGYSTDVTLGVWVGYDYPVTIPDSAMASKTWGRLLAEVLKIKPELSPIDSKFGVPDDLVKMEVSSTSGKLPSDLTREAGYLVTDWFNKKYIPTEIDDSLERARIVYFNNKRYIAKQETPNDMVDVGIFFKREPYVVPAKGEDDTYTKTYPVDYEKELPNEIDPRISTGTPKAPVALLVKMQGDRNVLSWGKNTDDNVVGYRLYRYSLLDIGFDYIGTVIQKNTAVDRVYYEDKTGYYLYYVVSVDVNGLESGPSNYVGNLNLLPIDNNGQDEEPNEEDIEDVEDVSIPSTPNNISSVHAPSTDFVILTWDQNPSTELVASYNIYFSSIKNGTYTLLDTVEDTLFTHNNIGEQEKLFYYITAVNQIGESSPSNIIEVK